MLDSLKVHSTNWLSRVTSGSEICRGAFCFRCFTFSPPKSRARCRHLPPPACARAELLLLLFLLDCALAQAPAQTLPPCFAKTTTSTHITMAANGGFLDPNTVLPPPSLPHPENVLDLPMDEEMEPTQSQTQFEGTSQARESNAHLWGSLLPCRAGLSR